jgi:hypothetical protein
MKIKKRGLFLILVLLIGVPFGIFAQSHRFGVPNLLRYDQKRYHFGFQLGYNLSDFIIRPKADLNEYDSLMFINTKPLSGFSLGIVASLRLGEYFDLRFIPGFSFGDRTINYYILYNDKTELITKKNIESVYLDLPIMLKFKSSRMHNFRVYVVGGYQYSVDLISAAKKQQANPKEVFLKVYPHDHRVLAGIGFDFYFAEFKFTTELKMTFGMQNLLKQEDNMFANSISSLKSKTIYISFYIE